MVKDNRNFVYKHEKTYEIRYTDVDVGDNLKLSSLLSLMLESACLSAEELGFGYADLSPKNIGFILINWYAKLNRAIKLGEKITVVTWPIKPQKLQIFRDFELYCGNEKVGVATSRWILTDLTTFKILPSSCIFSEVNIEYNPFRSLEYNEWKIPDCDGEFKYEKLVTLSDYDHYFHVNNTRYAEMLLDAFGVQFMATRAIKTVLISYVKQCKEGEIIGYYSKNTDGVWDIEGRVNDEVRVKCRVEFYEL